MRDDRRASEVIRRMKSLLKKAPFELKSLDLNGRRAGNPSNFFSSLAVARKGRTGLAVITPDALPILGDRIQLRRPIL